MFNDRRSGVKRAAAGTEQMLARLPRRLRELSVARVVQSAALCVALWCVLYAPQLLPSFLVDNAGLWIAILVGLALPLVRLDRAIRWVLVVATAGIAVIANTSLVDFSTRSRIRDDPMPAEGVAAIIPVSGNINNEGTLNAEATDHLLTALELVKAGKSPLLVTTTVEQSFPYPIGQLTSTPDQARLIGMFSQTIEWLRTPVTHSTRDEAVASAMLLVPRGIHRIAVVASPMHTRRACAAFEAVGFQVVCVVSRRSIPGGRIRVEAPRDRLAVFGDWVYEVLASAEYRLRGWVTDAPASRG